MVNQILKNIILGVSTIMIFAAPVYSQGDPLKDGTKTVIFEEEMESLLDWAENTDKELSYLQSTLHIYKEEDEKIERYVEVLSTVVQKSPDLNGLKMRKFANRALVLSTEIAESSGWGNFNDFRIKMFQELSRKAQIFFQSDIEFIRNGVIPEHNFLVESYLSFKYLYTISRKKGSKLSNKARRVLVRSFVGKINVDLYQSEYSPLVAFEIKHINELIKEEVDKHKEREILYLLDKAFGQIKNAN